MLKHPNGNLELVEEVWDSTEINDNGNELYTLPHINTFNGICGVWTSDHIQKLTKSELINEIKNNLGWLNEDEYEEELEDTLDVLKQQLDEWNISFKNIERER